MTVHWSLGYFKEHGHKITAYCEQPGPIPMCRHSAVIDLDKAIERFGPDFIVPNAYARFVGSLKCAKCGSKQISLQFSAPEKVDVTPAQPVWLKGVSL